MFIRKLTTYLHVQDEKKESTPLCEDTHPLIGSIDQDATSSIFSVGLGPVYVQNNNYMGETFFN